MNDELFWPGFFIGVICCLFCLMIISWIGLTFEENNNEGVCAGIVNQTYNLIEYEESLCHYYNIEVGNYIYRPILTIQLTEQQLEYIK